MREWLDLTLSHDEVKDFVLAAFRLATYTNAPDLVSAAAAIEQLKKALDTSVMYLDGGWQTLVDGLHEAAVRAGVIVGCRRWLPRASSLRSGDELVHDPNQRVRINRLDQNLVSTCRQGLVRDLIGASHNYYDRHPAVLKCADQSDKLNAGSSWHAVAEQNDVVRLVPGQSLHRGVSIEADGDTPSAFLKDLGEQPRDTLGAVNHQHWIS